MNAIHVRREQGDFLLFLERTLGDRSGYPLTLRHHMVRDHYDELAAHFNVGDGTDGLGVGLVAADDELYMQEQIRRSWARQSGAATPENPGSVNGMFCFTQPVWMPVLREVVGTSDWNELAGRCNCLIDLRAMQT